MPLLHYAPQNVPDLSEEFPVLEVAASKRSAEIENAEAAVIRRRRPHKGSEHRPRVLDAIEQHGIPLVHCLSVLHLQGRFSDLVQNRGAVVAARGGRGSSPTGIFTPE